MTGERAISDDRKVDAEPMPQPDSAALPSTVPTIRTSHREQRYALLKKPFVWVAAIFGLPMSLLVDFISGLFTSASYAKGPLAVAGLFWLVMLVPDQTDEAVRVMLDTNLEWYWRSFYVLCW